MRSRSRSYVIMTRSLDPLAESCTHLVACIARCAGASDAQAEQPAVIVKAREVDVGIVQGVLDGARSRFKQAYGSDAPSITMAGGLPARTSIRWVLINQVDYRCQAPPPCLPEHQAIIQVVVERNAWLYGANPQGIAAAFNLSAAYAITVCCAGKGDDEMETCTGGVSVASANGKIVVNNTLDDRLRIAFSANLPQFRQVLFGNSEK